MVLFLRFEKNSRCLPALSLVVRLLCPCPPSRLTSAAANTTASGQPPTFRCAWAASSDVQFRLRLLLAKFLHEFVRVINIADINIQRRHHRRE